MNSIVDITLNILEVCRCIKYDGNLFFESPTQWNTNRITIKPEVGQLLLFPSWLYHGVTNHTTDYPRISLSFNIIFDII